MAMLECHAVKRHDKGHHIPQYARLGSLHNNLYTCKTYAHLCSAVQVSTLDGI